MKGEEGCDCGVCNYCNGTLREASPVQPLVSQEAMAWPRYCPLCGKVGYPRDLVTWRICRKSWFDHPGGAGHSFYVRG